MEQQPVDNARHSSSCPRPQIPYGADRCPACGVLQPGNRAAFTHGLKSHRAQLALMKGQEHLREAFLEHRRELHEHVGGDAAGVLKLDMADRYARLCVLEQTLEADIVEKGLFSKNGKPRQTVAMYLQIVDRLNKLAALIGVERVAKPVPSISEYLKQREERDNRILHEQSLEGRLERQAAKLPDLEGELLRATTPDAEDTGVS